MTKVDCVLKFICKYPLIIERSGSPTAKAKQGSFVHTKLENTCAVDEKVFNLNTNK